MDISPFCKFNIKILSKISPFVNCLISVKLNRRFTKPFLILFARRIAIFIYWVLLYDDKMKVLFHLKGGQKNELLLNLIFPDYPDKRGRKQRKRKRNRFIGFSFGRVCVYVPFGGQKPYKSEPTITIFGQMVLFCRKFALDVMKIKQ